MRNHADREIARIQAQAAKRATKRKRVDYFTLAPFVTACAFCALVGFLAGVLLVVTHARGETVIEPTYRVVVSYAGDTYVTDISQSADDCLRAVSELQPANAHCERE